MNTKQMLFYFGSALLLGMWCVQGAIVIRGDSVLTLDGDITARIHNGTIYCDKLTCPAESFKCIIVKNNTAENINQIEVTRECLDRSGNTTAKTVEQVANKSPGQKIRSYAQIDLNGNISSYTSGGNSFNQTQANQLGEKIRREVEDRLRRAGIIPGRPFIPRIPRPIWRW
ncbi:uncharacterized protein LOC129776596 [Toxorhynchites rutilus septentrionalis]|uniref:uncharacterized protein LOC129776596 n=1 Tax=Toxorhynchites rutilus septentrionalis TaxID=329112 RepID=UPI00247AA8BA|nr:uncharacterized protein LOC129776596 [Toxorhynchites rutilus septentrionalis]